MQRRVEVGALVRRVVAGLVVSCLVSLSAVVASAQVGPSAAPGPTPPPASFPPGAPATGLPAGPAPPAPPVPSLAPPASAPGASPGNTESPAPAESAAPTPQPVATPTPPPIIVEPPSPAVEPNRTIVARVNSALGTITATVADTSIVTVTVDQNQRALYITGHNVGTTTITVRDDRGLTRDVPVRVAYRAGAVAETTTARITGDPASAAFVRESAIGAAIAAAQLRTGAQAVPANDLVRVNGDLALDNHVTVDVPLQLLGQGYFTVDGTTHVDVENIAVPRTRPARLLVSDYPERLTANGLLFSATIDRSNAQRFLYYHYNPGGEKYRRIVVKATNSSAVPAVVHLIMGIAGPSSNEMEVGHISTKTFLVRERRNEGSIVTIPGNTTTTLINHPLPTNAIVSGLMQMREVTGEPLKVDIVAQDAFAPLEQTAEQAELLSGGAPHARGIYPVPEFFSDYTFFVDGPPLEIPVGQLPLPNLREGEALAGDYGVKQSMRVIVVNTSRSPQPIALYANPRGGGATGTFLIDNTIVQAHRLTAFSKYKLWQETIAPGTYRTLQVTTMPEGGSSYPIRLIFAQDDGSVAPGAPGSPIY